MDFLDGTLYRKIHTNPSPCTFLQYVMAFFAVIFNSEISAFFWTYAILILPWSASTFLLGVTIPTVTVILVVLLKRLIGRERPTSYAPRKEALLFDFRGKENNKSMPSGDAAQAAAFWGFMAMRTQLPWYIAVFLVFLTMNSRVYFMCHFPTDTIIGAVLGLLVTFASEYLVGLYL